MKSINPSGPVCATTDSFDRDVVESSIPVVVAFWAPRCERCRAVAPFIDKLAAEWGGLVKVVKVNVDDEPTVAQGYRVSSIPTLVAVRGRDVVGYVFGSASPATMENLFIRMAGALP